MGNKEVINYVFDAVRQLCREVDHIEEPDLDALQTRIKRELK